MRDARKSDGLGQAGASALAGRREDPTLARDLDELRRRAGLSYRELARRTGCPTSTLNDALRGTRFPKLETVLAVARACGSDPEPWRRRWAGAGSARPLALLPADVGTFTGREAALAEASSWLAPAGGRPVARLGVVSGMAGIGKTALAVHLGHRYASAFPDGQLFLDLQGFTPGVAPLTPARALARLLLSHGVPAAEIPADEGDRAALLRSRLCGRRVLMVLDNARNEAQVRPLLPREPGCAALVTSRNALAGLAAVDDARVLTLDTLTPGEAVELLERVVGAARVRREASAARELGRLCAWLPLALRVVAAHLATRPDLRLGALADRLATGNRLAVLGIPDDPRATVRVAFDVSYQALGERARSLYRMLGLVPGVDCTRETAAAVLDTDVGSASALLGELSAAHLVQEHVPGRYQLHDLLREDSAERCRLEDGSDVRSSAVTRVLHCWLAAAGRATLVLDARATRRVTVVPTPHDNSGISTPAEATAWVDGEHGNLLAAARFAAGSEDAPELAVWLTAALYRPLHFRGYWQDLLALRRLAAETAARIGDRSGEALALEDVGFTSLQAADPDGAIASASRSLEMWRELGDAVGEQSCLNILGLAYTRLGRLAEAAGVLEQALAVCRSSGNARGEAGVLIGLGAAHHLAGRHSEAISCYRQSLALHEELGNPDGQAVVLGNLGSAYQETGAFDEAIACHERSLEIAKAYGHRNQQATSLLGLADAHHLRGAQAEARSCWRAALDILEAIDDPRVPEIRERLGLE